MRNAILGVLLIPAFITPALAQEITEIRCGKVLQREGAVTPRFAVDDDLHVMQQTSTGAFTLADGGQVKSVFCFRSSIVPTPGDYKVVNAGYPLMIYARDATRLRIAVLETEGGRLQYRGVAGTRFEPALRQQIQSVLDDSVPKFQPRPVVR